MYIEEKATKRGQLNKRNAVGKKQMGRIQKWRKSKNTRQSLGEHGGLGGGHSLSRRYPPDW